MSTLQLTRKEIIFQVEYQESQHHQVDDENCDRAALSWAEKIAGMQSGSFIRTRQLLNTDIELLRLRLEAELDNFVSQVQTQQALDGIDHFLRRQTHV